MSKKCSLKGYEMAQQAADDNSLNDGWVMWVQGISGYIYVGDFVREDMVYGDLIWGWIPEGKVILRWHSFEGVTCPKDLIEVVGFAPCLKVEKVACEAKKRDIPAEYLKYLTSSVCFKGVAKSEIYKKVPDGVSYIMVYDVRERKYFYTIRASSLDFSHVISFGDKRHYTFMDGAWCRILDSKLRLHLLGSGRRTYFSTWADAYYDLIERDHEAEKVCLDAKIAVVQNGIHCELEKYVKE